MAISSVRAQVNGTWYTLSYDSASGSYKGTITAPGSTSFNREGGYYDVTIEATNTAGTKTIVNGSDLADLQLVVRETVKPLIVFQTPTTGAHLTNNKPEITFFIADEGGGSGVNIDNLSVKLDGKAVSFNEYTETPYSAGYTVVYVPAAALSDGSHTVTVDCTDNDGNQAVTATTTFIVDTVPPTLNVTAPTNALVTYNENLGVTGSTNDASSSPVTVTIKVNNVDQGSVTVAANGSFSKTVTLVEGSNTIVVTATDAAGKVSTVTRTVTKDVSVPVVQSANITPNPVNAGATVIISVVIV